MELVLHIGAHRTGSTMVERSITASIAAAPGCGVALWAPRRLRDIKGFQAITRLSDDKGQPVDHAAARTRDAVATRLADDVRQEQEAGARRLILSEENFIGGMRNNFRTGIFYPGVARRLTALADVLPMVPQQIALGIRNYGEVLTSAYHYLPQAGQAAPQEEKLRDGILADKRGWPNVVEDVAQVWPDARILVWTQEDLSRDLAKVCAAVADLDAAAITVPEGRINALKPSTPKTPLFDAQEARHLTHRYNRHRRRLRSDPRVQWIGGAA
ncbi:hypothetical protein [Thalassorhabdomicrobium marinisediminis]|uniref:hypothetical protein n=1 Tax=Thalassorhabdomicrobium marinisediminis TaxID=2170577 RepID=UPI002490F6E5|nr:hypothetical protein [Thalassorhabdomicrobium marinisediminis]